MSAKIAKKKPSLAASTGKNPVVPTTETNPKPSTADGSLETETKQAVVKPVAPPGSSRPWTQITPKLSSHMLKGIADFGFTSMTPVQAATIPAFLSYKDVCVQAVTGSGKTMAFVIPILELLSSPKKNLGKHDLGAIILTPTRELAKQITAIITRFLPFLPKKLSVSQCIGGRDVQADVHAIFENGCNILVATPGRLEWVLGTQSFINHRALEVLVLDEADRLLELGFASSLEKILRIIPKQRRTGLFSATLTDEVEELAKTGLRNPVKITVKVQYKGPQDESQDTAQTHQAIPSTLTNYYSLVNAEEKLFHLVNFLLEHKDQKVIVFFLTCADVDYFYRILATFPALAAVFTPHNIEVLQAIGAAHLASVDKSKPLLAPMHGKMPQSKRDSLYQSFRDAHAGALLCTDVAARGVDIPEVDWILQYDAPQNPDFFIHRIGRAARAGRQGSALVYLNKNEDTFVDFLKVKQVPISELPISSVPAEWTRKLWEPLQEKYFRVKRLAQASVTSTEAEEKEEDVKENVKEDEEEEEGEEDMYDEDMDDEDEEAEEEDERPKKKFKAAPTERTAFVRMPGEEEVEIELPPLPSSAALANSVNTNLYLLQRVELKQRKDKKQLKALEAKHRAEAQKKRVDEELARKQYRLPVGTRVEVVHDGTHIVQHARWLVSRDRHMFNLASNAFVSHVRAYKEHKCRFIFVFDELPFRHVAVGFGLIIMPQLPDLKRYNVTFPKLTRTQVNEIPFLDSEREKFRLEQQEEKKRKNAEAKADRLVKAAQRHKERKMKEEIRKKKKKTRAKRTFEEMQQEWEELAAETKAMKKMKSGRITEQELEEELKEVGRAKVNKEKIKQKVIGQQPAANNNGKKR